MIPRQLTRFVSDVARATEAGEIGWAERPGFGRDVYVCEHNRYELQISSQWNDDQEAMFIHFLVEMPNGERGSFSTSHWEDDYPQMRTLYELATISAAKITPESLKGFFSK